MTTATMTSKGQITIPSSVRSDFNIGSGDHIEFIPVAVGKYEMIAITWDVKTLKGLSIIDKLLSVEEMNAAILKTASLL
jgi:AbrB family looped-hinge helix DNA binding protein